MVLNKIKRVRPLASFYGLLSAAFYSLLGVKNGNCQLTVGIMGLRAKLFGITELSNAFRAQVIWIGSFL